MQGFQRDMLDVRLEWDWDVNGEWDWDVNGEWEMVNGKW